MVTKLNAQDISDAYETENEEQYNEAVHRSYVQRKELRSDKQREAGELIGRGSHKHRKY